jgi:hypothetical protein
MDACFAFQSVPPRLAIVSCVIYVAVMVLLPRALIFVSGKSDASVLLLMSRWGWTILNAVIFLGAFSLAWQLVMPRPK